MTLNEIYRTAKANGQADICRFMRDAKRAGLRLRPYNGRCFWRGPAVVVRSIDVALQATKVKCGWDNLGLDMIVHPRESLRGVDQV